MLSTACGSLGTRNSLCNSLAAQGLDGRHFRAEFSAASLKLLVLERCRRRVDHFRTEFSAASLKLLVLERCRRRVDHFRAEISAASLKLTRFSPALGCCTISALNSARPH